MVDRRETRRRTGRQNSNDAIFIIPASVESALNPDSLATDNAGGSSHTTPARLIFTTGFALSLFLVLVAYLDEKMGRMAIFGFLAMGFFFLLVRAPRNRMS